MRCMVPSIGSGDASCRRSACTLLQVWPGANGNLDWLESRDMAESIFYTAWKYDYVLAEHADDPHCTAWNIDVIVSSVCSLLMQIR
jgi:hypothetical protein